MYFYFVKAFTITATCDNVMNIFVDGVLLGKSSNLWKSSTYTLSGVPSVVAIECMDQGVIGGILASLSNGVNTDRSWKCSSMYVSGPPIKPSVKIIRLKNIIIAV